MNNIFINDPPPLGPWLCARRTARKLLPGFVTLLSLSGCATVFEGTSQDITVNTNPPGASCVFTRQGVTIGTIPVTPAILSVQKRKYDIMITCAKSGYSEASYLNHSGVSAAIAGNVAADIILTAGLSSIIDSADGADNKYDSAVNITLAPAQIATSSSSGADINAAANGHSVALQDAGDGAE